MGVSHPSNVRKDDEMEIEILPCPTHACNHHPSQARTHAQQIAAHNAIASAAIAPTAGEEADRG